MLCMTQRIAVPSFPGLTAATSSPWIGRDIADHDRWPSQLKSHGIMPMDGKRSVQTLDENCHHYGGFHGSNAFTAGVQYKSQMPHLPQWGAHGSILDAPQPGDYVFVNAYQQALPQDTDSEGEEPLPIANPGSEGTSSCTSSSPTLEPPGPLYLDAAMLTDSLIVYRPPGPPHRPLHLMQSVQIWWLSALA